MKTESEKLVEALACLKAQDWRVLRAQPGFFESPQYEAWVAGIKAGELVMVETHYATRRDRAYEIATVSKVTKRFGVEIQNLNLTKRRGRCFVGGREVRERLPSRTFTTSWSYLVPFDAQTIQRAELWADLPSLLRDADPDMPFDVLEEIHKLLARNLRAKR
jgi:hypothetical protein